MFFLKFGSCSNENFRLKWVDKMFLFPFSIVTCYITFNISIHILGKKEKKRKFSESKVISLSSYFMLLTLIL